MKNVILVDFPVKGYLYGTGIKEITVRKPLNPIFRFLRKIPLFSHLISNTVERKHWEDECMGYGTIVLFDTYAGYFDYAQKIESIVPNNTRLVLYLLNPEFFSDNHSLLSNRWEKWTFSKTDADRFDFKYGGTFYNAMLLNVDAKHYEDNKKNVDVLFVGTDKGRKQFVLNLKQRLVNSGIKCDFRIVDNFKSLFSLEYSREVSYLKLCGLIQRARVLLDVVQEGQQGLTLRIMEALLFGKKIITTNKNINKDRDFAGNKNIYVLDKDNINGLQAFIMKPFVPYAEEQRKKYSFTEWMRRLENGQEME